jgi:hypothetical protein
VDFKGSNIEKKGEIAVALTQLGFKKITQQNNVLTNLQQSLDEEIMKIITYFNPIEVGPW